VKSVTFFLLFYFLCFLSLLTFFGCGEDTEESPPTSYLIGEHSEKPDEVYIPEKWYKTKDPLERNDYFRAVLIKQFGDIPDVHIIADYQQKRIQGLHVTIGEYNAYLDARKRLWPNQKTPRKLGEMHETDDPEVFAKLYREQLIKQFGDVPEIDILVEVEKKWKAGKGVPREEYIDYAHAMFQLFPSEETLRELQRVLAEQDEE
jgi:hypothetical protein